MNEKCETCEHLKVKAHELGLYEECELNRCIYKKQFTDIDRQKLEMWDEMVSTISHLLDVSTTDGWLDTILRPLLDRAKKIQEAVK